MLPALRSHQEYIRFEQFLANNQWDINRDFPY